MTRSCLACGSDLSTTHPNRRFCNNKCRYAVRGEQIRARTRKWRADNAERALYSDLEKHLRRKFGISVEQYTAIFDRQGGRCAVCLRTPEEVGDGRRLAVDHCHESGHIRGLLCRHCNTVIGTFQESAEVIGRALKYVLGEQM